MNNSEKMLDTYLKNYSSAPGEEDIISRNAEFIASRLRAPDFLAVIKSSDLLNDKEAQNAVAQSDWADEYFSNVLYDIAVRIAQMERANEVDTAINDPNPYSEVA
ncbi:hypothetical protein ACOGYE_001902 [Edwardsiella piscicida]